MTTVVFDNPAYAAGQCIFDNDIITSSGTRPYRKGWPDWSVIQKDDDQIVLLVVAIDGTNFH